MEDDILFFLNESNKQKRLKTFLGLAQLSKIFSRDYQFIILSQKVFVFCSGQEISLELDQVAKVYWCLDF